MDIDSIIYSLADLSLEDKRLVCKKLKTMIKSNEDEEYISSKHLSDNIETDIYDRDDDEWECEGYNDYEEYGVVKCRCIVYSENGINARYCSKHINQRPAELNCNILKYKLDKELDEYNSQTKRIK